MEDKIDKRTKAYRDSQEASEAKVDANPLAPFVTPLGDTVTESDGNLAATVEKQNEAIAELAIQIYREAKTERELLESILEEIAVIRGRLMCLPFVTDVPDPAPDAGPAMTPVTDNEKCMKCGVALPELSEPRRYPEACQACVWKNADKKVG